MSEQTSAPASAPASPSAAPAVAPTPAPSEQPRKGSTDALVDDAMAFLEENRQKPAKVEREEPAQARGERQPEGEPGPAEPEGEDDARGDVETASDSEGDDVEPEHDPLLGTKEQPFTVQDLPADKYIELKIDGKKETVPLAELAAGYVRERTFHQRINQTKQLADRAEQLAQRANATQEKLRTELRTFLTTPDELYEYFLADDQREAVLEQVAMRYAELRRRHREEPDERLRFQRERDKARLDAERRAFEEERQRAQEERARQEAHERGWQVFKPGWDEGLRRSGFPEPTKQLYDEVMLRCQAQVQRGEPVTSDDVARYTQLAAKYLDLKPAAAKPKPAPAMARKREAVNGERVNGKRDPWADKPLHERRRDPEYWMRDLGPRDWR